MKFGLFAPSPQKYNDVLAQLKHSHLTKNLTFYLGALNEKQEELECGKDIDENTGTKCAALRKIMIYVNSAMEKYNQNPSSKERLEVITYLRRTLEAFQHNKEIAEALALHRNNKQYYANFVRACMTFSGGLMLSASLPESFLASFIFYYAGINAAVDASRLNDFSARTESLLNNFKETLAELEVELQ